VISPLLANLFLHYAFDVWMRRTFPQCPFERYADDAVVHCRNRAEAQAVVEAIRDRFAQCRLELHPTKTRIVYCKDDGRPGKYDLEDLAQLVNPAVRGWMNYYGRFYRSRCVQVLRHLDEALAAWVRRKFKRFRRRESASVHWLGRIARREPTLFVHWQLGIRPAAGV
jgi:RNA-directed DNA polymerase